MVNPDTCRQFHGRLSAFPGVQLVEHPSIGRSTLLKRREGCELFALAALKLGMSGRR